MKKIALGLFLIISTAALAKVANQVYRIPSSGPLIATYGAVNLASSAAVTGILPLGNGGTGIATCASGAVGYSNGTTFVCDTTKLSINTSTGVLTFQNGTTATYATSSPSVNRLQFSDPVQIAGSTGPIMQRWSNNTLAVVDATSGGGGLPAVISAGPATNGLMIVRGGGSTTPSSSSCGTALGEGYSCNRSGTGVYTPTFSTQFQDTPICVCNVNAGGFVCRFTAQSSTSATTDVSNYTNTAQDSAWTFICVGQRKTGT